MNDLLVRGGTDAHGPAAGRGIVVDGEIAEPEPRMPDPVLDAAGLTVLPGLIDLQVNGAAGLDITADPDRLWDVAAGCRATA